MKIRELRRTAKICIEEGDDVALRILDPGKPSDFKRIEVYVKIDGITYGTAFNYYDEYIARRNLHSREISLKEVSDSDLSGLKWEKYKL